MTPDNDKPKPDNGSASFAAAYGSAAWHDVPTCEGWWWSDTMERWSKWADSAPESRIIANAGPWWGPWTKPPNAEVSDGGPLTHESPVAQSRRSLH